MKYLLFGDSIAWGMNDFKNRGWQGHLKKHIHKKIREELRDGKTFVRLKYYFSIKKKKSFFINFAFPGDNSLDLLYKLNNKGRKIIENSPEEGFTVIIAIGANDSQIGKSKIKKSIEKKEFRDNILKILRLSKKLARRVIVIGLLPVDEKKIVNTKMKKHYFNKRIEEYNRILKECSQKENVFFKDFYNNWIKKDFKKFLSDGLHPNKEGHELIFEELKSLF